MQVAANLGLGLDLLASHSVVLNNTMHLVRGTLCWQVTTTLLSHDMQKHWANSIGCLDLCAQNGGTQQSDFRLSHIWLAFAHLPLHKI